MSDLGTGPAGPANWAYPVKIYVNGKYIHDGMWWMGKEAVTVADIVALADAFGSDVDVDTRTLVGRHNRSWSTLFNKHNPGAVPSGGEGSTCYELKLVGEEGNGVQFSKDGIWHYDADNNFIKGIPGCAGEYHKAYAGDGYYDSYAGPEPGSVAATMLGDGEYYWDAERALYDIRF